MYCCTILYRHTYTSLTISPYGYARTILFICIRRYPSPLPFTCTSAVHTLLPHLQPLFGLTSTVRPHLHVPTNAPPLPPPFAYAVCRHGNTYARTLLFVWVCTYDIVRMYRVFVFVCTYDIVSYAYNMRVRCCIVASDARGKYACTITYCITRSVPITVLSVICPIQRHENDRPNDPTTCPKIPKKPKRANYLFIEIVVCINEKLARFGHFRIFGRYLSTNLTHLYASDAPRTAFERRARVGRTSNGARYGHMTDNTVYRYATSDTIRYRTRILPAPPVEVRPHLGEVRPNSGGEAEQWLEVRL